MAVPWEPGLGPLFQRVHRAIVVIDVVVSVRLIEADEVGTVTLWRRFVEDVRSKVLPPLQGSLVKSLGDGLLLEFETAPQAVQAALEMQRRLPAFNEGLAQQKAIQLHMGVHVADVLRDAIDVYGTGVNVAARLAGIAGPNEIVVSADVRARLVDGLDAEVVDLGECWLKHMSHSVRAFRIGPAPSYALAANDAISAVASETVGVAIMPFVQRVRDAEHAMLGHLLADDVIAQLSRISQLRVISRLSTSAFDRRSVGLDVIASALGADYVLHGSYAIAGTSRVRVIAQLTQAATHAVVWSDSIEADVTSLLFGQDPGIDRLIADVCAAIVGSEIHRACTLALPTLSSYTILLGAISLLHSLSRSEFERAREMLAYVTERHPRQAAPRAWTGLWHVMRVGQGWSPDPAVDASQGRAQLAHALDIDPVHSLSLAVDGLVCAYVNKDLATAGDRYAAALHANPNESLAWLYQSAWHAYQEQGTQAVESALHAQALSPLDPLKYYYDNFTSTAMLAAGDLEGAIRYGNRSLRANRLHGPTLRILAVAHSLSGDMAAARAAVEQMRKLEPGFTVRAFRERYPGRDTEQVERYAQALLAAGLPQ